MITDDIELDKSTIEKLDSEIDEYLCHRRFFQLSLKFGENVNVTCQPYKASWLVSIYSNYELVQQIRINTFPKAFQKFQEYCIEALSMANQEYRKEH